MKKLLFGTMLLALVIVVPIPTMAGVNISISISSATTHRICRTTRVDSATWYDMSTLLLTLMWTSFSGMVGGGVFGKVVGIAHVIITGAGVIITMFQVFILM